MQDLISNNIINSYNHLKNRTIVILFKTVHKKYDATLCFTLNDQIIFCDKEQHFDAITARLKNLELLTILPCNSRKSPHTTIT